MLYAQWVRLIKIYGTPAVYDRILQIHIGVSKTRVYIYFRKLNIKQTKPVCVYITWSHLSKLTDSKTVTLKHEFKWLELIDDWQTFKLLGNLK